MVERAWVALHSSWLIPAQNPMNKNLRMWFPLRKLMAKARTHRDIELNRLRGDPHAAARLDKEDQKIPPPSSPGPFLTGSSVDVFRARWRKLVALREGAGDGTSTAMMTGVGLVDDVSMHTTYTSPTARPNSTYGLGELNFNMTFEPTYLGTNERQAGQTSESTIIRDPEPATTRNTSNEIISGQTVRPSYDPFPTVPADFSNGRTMGSGSVPWLWADADPSVDVFSNLDVDAIDFDMDVDGEVDWYSWIDTAKSVERDARSSSNGRS